MSNVWDKYKSTVRTHISVPESRTLITENRKVWFDVGYFNVAIYTVLY